MKYNVFVVDDEPQIRTKIIEVLRNQVDLEIEVTEAGDGAIALELATKAEQVDLFIVDYNMPNTNGLEAVQKIVEMDRFHKSSIFFYTTETNPELVAKAKALAPKSQWVIKPLKPEPFAKAVTLTLQLAS